MPQEVEKKTKPSTNSSLSEYNRHTQQANNALREAQRLIQQRREANQREITRPKT